MSLIDSTGHRRLILRLILRDILRDILGDILGVIGIPGRKLDLLLLLDLFPIGILIGNNERIGVLRLLERILGDEVIGIVRRVLRSILIRDH